MCRRLLKIDLRSRSVDGAMPRAISSKSYGLQSIVPYGPRLNERRQIAEGCHLNHECCERIHGAGTNEVFPIASRPIQATSSGSI